MEALTATPRALFSPAAAIATPMRTRRCCVGPVRAAAASAEPAGEEKPAAPKAAAGDAAAAPKKVLKKKPIYSSKNLGLAIAVCFCSYI